MCPESSTFQNLPVNSDNVKANLLTIFSSRSCLRFSGMIANNKPAEYLCYTLKVKEYKTYSMSNNAVIDT
jgi:hypothetical protein